MFIINQLRGRKIFSGFVTVFQGVQPRPRYLVICDGTVDRKTCTKSFRDSGTQIEIAVRQIETVWAVRSRFERNQDGAD
jgi:hypothetical protein